jgi:hypothetical protein
MQTPLDTRNRGLDKVTTNTLCESAATETESRHKSHHRSVSCVCPRKVQYGSESYEHESLANEFRRCKFIPKARSWPRRTVGYEFGCQNCYLLLTTDIVTRIRSLSPEKNRAGLAIT